LEKEAIQLDFAQKDTFEVKMACLKQKLLAPFKVTALCSLRGRAVFVVSVRSS
jgi:hypothetical protein